VSACSSCRRPILWCVTEGGKRMPIDPEPHADGNVVKTGRTELVPGQYRPVDVVRVLTVAEREHTLFDDGEPGEPDPEDVAGARYMPHFATCPSADRHRRR